MIGEQFAKRLALLLDKDISNKNRAYGIEARTSLWLSFKLFYKAYVKKVFVSLFCIFLLF